MGIVAWPPPTPPNDRQNATPELNNHPGDHNKIADALDTLIARMGGAYTEIAYNEVIVAQSNIQTTIVDITNLQISFTLTSARRVLLWASGYFTKAAPDTSATAYFQIANNTNVEQVGRANWCNAPGQCGIEVRRRVILAAGSYTYKGRCATSAGFLNTNANANEPLVIGAIDLGPQ